MLNSETTARDYLADLLLNALIYRPGCTPLATLAELLPPDLGLGPQFIGTVLAENPRFAAVEGRYDIAYRDSLANRPIGGAAEIIIAAYGRPMPKPLLANELTHTGKGDLVFLEDIVQNVVTGGALLALDDRFVCLPDWLFVPMPDAETDRCLYLNGLADDEDLAAVTTDCTVAKLASPSLTETAYAVLTAADRPLSNKALGFLVGTHQGEKYDPAELLRQMVCDDEQRFLALCGPRWVLSDWTDDLHKSLQSQAPKEDMPQHEADIQEALAKEIPPDKRYELSDEETTHIMAVIDHSKAPLTIRGILADVVGLMPNQRKYAPATQAVEQLLSGLQTIKKLHPGCYLRLGALPTWIRIIPQSLLPAEWKPELAEDGTLATEDVVLSPEGLTPEALEAAADPYYDDIGETCISPVAEASDAEFISCPLLHHHYLAGTLRLRATDADFFADEDDLTMINLRCQDRTLPAAWLNKQTGLMYGLGAWYRVHMPLSGGLLTITHSDAPSEYLLRFADETDAQTYLGRQSLQEVLDWRERLGRKPTATKRMLQVLLANDKGLPFNQLWAQLNILRRTTRVQLASLLSFYHCFTYGEGNRWHFEPDKLPDGYDDAKLHLVIGLELPESDPEPEPEPEPDAEQAEAEE